MRSKKKLVVWSLTVSIGLAATLQIIPALILRLIRETTQRQHVLERLKPLCIHTQKGVKQVKLTDVPVLERKFRGIFGAFQTNNGQLLRLNRQGLGVWQIRLFHFDA